MTPAPAPAVPDYKALRRKVRHDLSLSPQARILFEDVCDLSEKEGACKAGDGHFAKVYDTSRRTVRRWMNELREAGFIAVEGATRNRKVRPSEPGAEAPGETPKEAPANPEPQPELRTPDVLGHRTRPVLSEPDLGHPMVSDLGHLRDDTKSINTPRGGEARAREESPAATADGFDPEAEYRAMYPKAELNHYQISILRSLTDRRAFRKTLDVWAGTNYKGWNVIGFRDRYRKILAGEPGADGHKASPTTAANTGSVPDGAQHFM